MDGAEELETELPDDVYEQVTALSEEGNALCEAGDYGEAIARFASAHDMLPEPKDRWSAATWLLAGIGDCYFLQGRYREALDHFSAAQRAAGGTEEAFIWYRLGQSLYELGEPRARILDALLSAYMLAGREIFEAEGETKYYDFLRRNADIGE
jgi:tetratricopeptide (TPR) repeat protein